MFSFVERITQPFSSNSSKQPPSQFVAFCLYFTRGYGMLLGAMAFFSVCVALMEVSLFRMLGLLVDWLNSYTPQELWAVHAHDLFIMAGIVLFALPLCVFLHGVILHQGVFGNYPMAIRWKAHNYLLRQSMEFYQDEFAGRIATKVMQTALAVRETVVKLLDVFLYIIIFFGGILLMVASLDVRLVIPFLVWLVAYIGVLKFFLPRLKAVSMRQANARSEMTGRLVDTYTNINTVKLFSHARREAEYARESMDDFLKTVYPQMRLAVLLKTCVWTLNALLIVSVSALCLYLWSLSFITAGVVAAAVGVILRLYGMSQWIMWEVSGLFENIGTVQDGINTLSQPLAIEDKADAKVLQCNSGAITFNAMNFDYGEKGGVISQFNLAIQPGEKIGLVGRSGAGKSTLVNLLLRFYDIKGGQILIDEQDIRDVTQDSLRANIGMVTQDSSLMHRSVYDNIAYGQPNATMEQVVAAAKKAQAYDFIQGLSDGQGRTGFDAHVGERGVKLSGGQRQRIAIARVLLKNAPILILDEATSALDSEVEADIQNNLIELMAGKSVIAIAHRLSTIAALDRLIVLDKGQIVEQGTHQELLANNGLYAQLWSRQSGGFLGEG
ncbi:ABC transporter ATP-binding protein [Marinagarivorans algicola]|uniref:ABC transporter ATP-binding protein n=1 Tax=Marinagarivorans algicola TaxID=1513270 RepID=UPI0006B40018|nr:ABC transporter ATP-binding protein [Marinagarivorans algicola]